MQVSAPFRLRRAGVRRAAVTVDYADSRDAILRAARLAGLRSMTLPSMRDVERRRTRIWTLAAALAITCAGAIWASWQLVGGGLLDRLGLSLGALVVATVFGRYCLDKEHQLREVGSLLVDERLLTTALSDHVHEIQTLLDAGMAVNSAHELETVLDIVLTNAVTMLNGSGGSIMRLAGEDLAVIASSGEAEPVGTRVPVATSPAGRAARMRETLLLTGHPTGPDGTGVPRGSVMAIPMVERDEVLGVLTVHAAPDRSLSEHDMRAATIFAHHAACAVAKANLLDGARCQAAELAHAVLHDSLTSLPNRTLLARRLDEAITRTRTGGATTAALFVDLNGFKAINDRLGHTAGDLLLVAFAERLQRCLRAGSVAARMGGDEFAVVVEGLAHPEHAVPVAQRILDSLTQPFALDGQEVRASASIGIAVVEPTDRDTTVDDVLHQADMAMYDAKRSGGTYRFFDAELHAAALLQRQLEVELSDALDNGELRAEYQPIVDITSREMLGVEALMRWHHPEHGILQPDAFLLHAVENGLMSRIGATMLRTACRQLVGWDGLLGDASPSYVSVNISAQHVESGMLQHDVQEALIAAGLAPNRLMIELTEESAIDTHGRGMHALSELRRMGVRLAIDDFGSHYSSLNYLLALPVDVLKLDRAFLRPLTAAPRAASVVRALCTLAEDLGLVVIAEGVESVSQAQLLRSLGVSYAQGFLYSPPVPPEQLAAMVGRAVHRDPLPRPRPAPAYTE